MFFPQTYEFFVIVPREKTNQTLKKITPIGEILNFSFPELRKLFPTRVELVEEVAKLDVLIDELKPEGKTNPYLNPLNESQHFMDIVQQRLEKINNEVREINYHIKRLKTITQLIKSAEFIGIVSIVIKPIDQWEAFHDELENQGSRLIKSTTFENEIIGIVNGAEGEYKGDDQELLKTLNEKIDDYQKAIERVERGKKDLANSFGPKILTIREQLEGEISIIDEKKKVSHSELFTFIYGTVEAKNKNNLDIDGVILIRPLDKKKQEALLDQMEAE